MIFCYFFKSSYNITQINDLPEAIEDQIFSIDIAFIDSDGGASDTF